MYDINKRRTGMDIKVKDIIAELEKENPEAVFTCCGDNLVFVHVEQDNSVVTIDAEDLCNDEGYEEAMDGGIDSIPAIKGESGYYISRQRYWEMLHKIINTIYETSENEVLREDLMNLNFTKEELNQLGYFNPTKIDIKGGIVPEPTEIDLARAKELLSSVLSKMKTNMTDKERIKYVGEFTEDELELLGEEKNVIQTISDNKEKVIAILDSFENLLEEKDITIPSDDREGEESEARLFGTEYYELEDKIINILEDDKPKAKCPIFFEKPETEVKMEIQMTVESKEKAEELKTLEHHIERLLDLDSYPEIKTVHDVKVDIIK